MRAALAVAAAAAAAVLTLTAPANAPVARPWHYPCRMHLANGAEWFTPARDFWAGRCQQ